MAADEDAALMARFVETRDRRVYAVLFQRHHRQVVQHVRRFVKSSAKAEELTQDVFIRVYTTKQYQPDTKFRTWLYRVATNISLNELRRPENRERIDSLDEDAAQPVRDLRPNPEASLAGRELATKIEAALAKLPAKQRAAFLMARQDQMSLEEIAEALETTVSAVKSLMHRALEGLRAEAEALRAEVRP